ncbi:hypothetical protein SAMN02745857_02252 [Andreprevotia lacus DSM 23236]|uniref:Uncharacterized protein n=1 Tax=Andreprevotia lacus DSM 23236 TaxID=1121001 RepID=A0A1W1XQD3_9NEIS|nr:hypothetical protein [Andreprevotia lacus]SMC25721.1 hypothetical protein SAMN02745857_02252 [Andreprevotia lacus DSM 23236]
MKKFVALGVLFCGMLMNASASESRYYQVSGNVTVDGPSFCQSAWPGSTYNGLRQGSGPYYYVACIKY